MRVFLIAVAIPQPLGACCLSLCMCVLCASVYVCVPLCLAGSGPGHCAVVHYCSNPPTQRPAR